LLNILGILVKKVFNLLEIEMPLNSKHEKIIMENFNFFEIVNGEKISLPRKLMVKKKKEAKVDDVTGKEFGLNETKCCEHPHESSTNKSSP
jgi:hypothetical protein